MKLQKMLECLTNLCNKQALNLASTQNLLNHKKFKKAILCRVNR